MRNIIYLFGILFTLASCEKKACYTCTTKVGASGSSSTANYCDLTIDDKMKIEQAGTRTDTYMDGATMVTVVTRTTCAEQ